MLRFVEEQRLRGVRVKGNTCVDTCRSSSSVLQLYRANVAEPLHNEGQITSGSLKMLRVASIPEAFSDYFPHEPPSARTQNANELASLEEAGGVINIEVTFLKQPGFTIITF